MLVSTIPDTTSMSPLASVVDVGYQRPAFMFGQTGPGVGEGVVGRGVGQAHVVRDVPAYDEQSAVREEREARAEDVVAGRGRWGDTPGGWIPELRAVARVRIPEHDLAGREHLGVYRPVRPRVAPATIDRHWRAVQFARADASSAHDQEKHNSRPSLRTATGFSKGMAAGEPRFASGFGSDGAIAAPRRDDWAEATWRHRPYRTDERVGLRGENGDRQRGVPPLPRRSKIARRPSRLPSGIG